MTLIGTTYSSSSHTDGITISFWCRMAGYGSFLVLVTRNRGRLYSCGRRLNSKRARAAGIHAGTKSIRVDVLKHRKWQMRMGL